MERASFDEVRAAGCKSLTDKSPWLLSDEKKDRPEGLSFFCFGKNYFRLPRSFTVMTVARSAAPTVMSLETVISPLNMAATRAA